MDQALKDLQAALREHNQRLRKLAGAKLIGGGKAQPKDRRCA